MFFLLGCIVYDVAKAEQQKSFIKGALDLSTKSATLQVDRTPEKIAEGIFEIDPIESNKVFEEYITDNLQENKSDILVNIIDYGAINNAPCEYTHPITGITYKINKPTYIAIMRINYKGLLMNRTIVLDNLSGTQLQKK